MVDLSKFSDSERNLIVSIPYRAGIWVSNADDNTGTKVDDKDERKALEATIQNFAAQGDKIPVAAAIMKDVQENKRNWAQWDALSTEDAVLADAQKAVALCKDRFTEKELNQYKETIWRAGLFVAQAYGEQVDPDNEMHFNNFIGRLFKGAPKVGSNPQNMSPKEKAALTKLKAALKS